MDKDLLMGIAKKAGIDVEEIIFSVNVSDIIGEIAFACEGSDITSDKLKKLIEVGKIGCEVINWANTIHLSILEFLEIKDELEGDENV